MTELPRGWVNVRFSDFGTWIGGGTPSKANPRFWNGLIPWVSPKDMKTKVIRETIDGITEDAVYNSAAKRVPPGSVLIVTRSGILAHTLPVAVTAVESTLNQDLKALALPDGIVSDYVAWGLRAFEQRILDTCRKGGTTVHSIEMPSLAAFEFPIAPTNEQRRIVEKIEAMFDEIDKGFESLKTARSTLGLYRQSLLKSASPPTGARETRTSWKPPKPSLPAFKPSAKPATKPPSTPGKRPSPHGTLAARRAGNRPSPSGQGPSSDQRRFRQESRFPFRANGKFVRCPA